MFVSDLRPGDMLISKSGEPHSRICLEIDLGGSVWGQSTCRVKWLLTHDMSVVTYDEDGKFKLDVAWDVVRAGDPPCT